MSEPAVQHVTSLDLKLEPWTWPFAVDNRLVIPEIFARLRAAKPALFNGKVLLMREPRIAGEHLTARYFEADFATFLAWRELGFPGEDIFSGFGMGALRSSDGVYLMGEMSPHTANAGRVYFPSGTPDLNDLVGDRIDIDGNIVREVEEETGLKPADYEALPGFHCVIASPAVALIQVLVLKQTAAAARQTILANIAREATPEFSDVHLVRSAADITPAMPRYVAAFVRQMADA